MTAKPTIRDEVRLERLIREFPALVAEHRMGAVLQQVADHDTGSPELWHTIGLMRAWDGDEAAAAVALHEAARHYADFDKAVSLIKGKPDEIEPDGAPNPSGKPRSSLQFNIWYHLALAHYLKGDFEKALGAWNECMKVSTNDDAIVATSDWLWMTLMRLGRKADAAKVLETIDRILASRKL